MERVQIAHAHCLIAEWAKVRNRCVFWVQTVLQNYFEWRIGTFNELTSGPELEKEGRAWVNPELKERESLDESRAWRKLCMHPIPYWSHGLTSMEFCLAVAAKHHAGFVVRSHGNVRRKLLSSSSLLTGALGSCLSHGSSGPPQALPFPWSSGFTQAPPSLSSGPLLACVKDSLIVWQLRGYHSQQPFSYIYSPWFHAQDVEKDKCKVDNEESMTTWDSRIKDSRSLSCHCSQGDSWRHPC